MLAPRPRPCQRASTPRGAGTAHPCASTVTVPARAAGRASTGCVEGVLAREPCWPGHFRHASTGPIGSHTVRGTWHAGLPTASRSIYTHSPPVADNGTLLGGWRPHRGGRLASQKRAPARILVHRAPTARLRSASASRLHNRLGITAIFLLDGVRTAVAGLRAPLLGMPGGVASAWYPSSVRLLASRGLAARVGDATRKPWSGSP
jgi:hypothetical protein